MGSESSYPVLACNVHAIPDEMRPIHQANTARIIAGAQEVQELPMGLAFRLPDEMEMLQTVVAFISYERLCCPFFHFVLDVEPEQRAVWLRLTGDVNVKEFLVSEGFGRANASLTDL